MLVYSSKNKKQTVIKPGTILLIAGGAVAYALINKGKALQSLNFYPKGVRAIKMDGITPVVTIALAVQNTSGQQAVLRSFAGNLFANNYFIGNVSSYTQTTIRPNAETVLVINVRLSVIGIVSDILKAFNGQGLSQVMELQAKANVDNFQVPINIKYKVG